jgi:menaquinone-dependent protoporphyrinogen oxidase
MKILILYATVEGQTQKIAETIARQVEDTGAEVVISDIGQAGSAMPGTFDGVVLCAPIHIGRYPPRFEQFVANWKMALQTIPTAFVSVSLAIASKNADERKEAEAFPDELARRTGWKAPLCHHAAGALKYLEYDFFKRWMLRRISEKEGGPVDTSRDYELTDWAALSRFVTQFLGALQKAA